MNYACGFNQSETGKYFEWIISIVYMEKNQSQVDGSLAYPSYRGWANFPYISLKDLANRLQEKQKVCWARRVTCLGGSPFFE